MLAYLWEGRNTSTFEIGGPGMSLKWKLIWPVAAFAVLVLVGLAAGPAPASADEQTRTALLIALAIALAVLVVVTGVVAEVRVCRPLRTILHTFGGSAGPDGLGNASDEVEAVRSAVGRLHDEAASLGNALHAAETRLSTLEAELQYSEERYV